MSITVPSSVMTLKRTVQNKLGARTEHRGEMRAFDSRGLVGGGSASEIGYAQVVKGPPRSLRILVK